MKFARLAMLLPLALGCFTGCSSVSEKDEKVVDVSGSATGKDGKPLDGVGISFIPLSEGANTADMSVVKGKFSGKLATGKYTYFYIEGKNKAAYKAIPDGYKETNANRTFEVKSATDSLDLKVE